MARHNAVRDVLFRLMCDSDCFSSVQLEQVIPTASAAAAAPRLDITAQGPNGTRYALDIVVPNPASASGLSAGAASTSGVTARLMEQAKRRKYPGAVITPFAVECFGLLGDSAIAFLRTMCRGLPLTRRGSYMSDLFQCVSAAIQRANAELVFTSLSRSTLHHE